MSPRRSPAVPDWAEALNFKVALRNCDTDIIGDWYRDPWGWPELRWVTSKKSDILVSRLNGRGVWRAAKIDVAKENFATRPAIVMDPVDRLIYQALIDRMSVDLIGDLDDWVYGWRLHFGDPKPGAYSRNDFQYDSFRGHLTTLATFYSAALKTDIVSCFASMPVDRLAEGIEQRVGSSAMTARLVEMLREWDRIPGRSGLPQRSAASAVIANMYLGGVDDVLRPYNKRSSRWRTLGARVTRWMDDIWLFGNDLGQLRKVQFELQSAVRELNLELNSAKTDVLEGEEVVHEVMNLQHSAVDGGLNQVPVDHGPLEDLIERVVEDPELTDRTTIRFLTKRMRTHELFGDYAQRLADVSKRMPQGADTLARLFRDSELWRDLKAWYVEDYARSPWGVMEWGVAQMGTMFPSGESGPKVVREYLAEALTSARISLPLAALATQRLAAWNKDQARLVIKEASSTADHPLLRRILGLGLLGVGGERATVRRLLGEFEENAVTLAMLEDTNFRRPKIVADFGGD